MTIGLYILVGFLGGIVTGNFYEDRHHEKKLDQCHAQLQMHFRGLPRNDNCYIIKSD